ncbi:MAG: hypothetical protein ACREU9_07620 [Gammaproteobacteria bacterium]
MFNDLSNLIEVVKDAAVPHCGVHWTDGFHAKVVSCLMQKSENFPQPFLRISSH